MRDLRDEEDQVTDEQEEKCCTYENIMEAIVHGMDEHGQTKDDLRVVLADILWGMFGGHDGADLKRIAISRHDDDIVMVVELDEGETKH